MKAVVHDRYGSFDLLQVRDVAQPVVGDEDVLVRVAAAALHVGDCFFVRGSPFVVRLMAGMSAPKIGIPGMDVAGRVEAVGGKVHAFKVGDQVFGAGLATCAEFVCITQKHLVAMPKGLTFAAAAALPTSGLAALHGLRNSGRLTSGQDVLINGASGGVGSYAVQIAKAFGARVTGVCSTANVDFVRSLGADHVVDYTREDFTIGTARYDVILDNIENRTIDECRRILKSSGTLVFNSGTGANGFKLVLRLIKPLLLSPFVQHQLRRCVSGPNAADLLLLKQLAEDGRIKPSIERVYTLDEVPAALRHIESGRARGKLVVQVAQDSPTALNS